VPALCSVLGTGDEEPVSLDVLKALYSLIAPDTTGAGRDARRLAGAAARAYAADPGRRAGHTCSEVFASGGVHALVRRAAAPRGAPLAAWRARQRARADPPARGAQIRLLANVLEFAGEPQRSVWTRELLSLLLPLAHRSRLVRTGLRSRAGLCPLGCLCMMCTRDAGSRVKCPGKVWSRAAPRRLSWWSASCRS